MCPVHWFCFTIVIAWTLQNKIYLLDKSRRWHFAAYREHISTFTQHNYSVILISEWNVCRRTGSMVRCIVRCCLKGKDEGQQKSSFS
jgi:hypothetical protein